MKPKNWIESLNLAIEGIIYAVKTERHMRYHLYAAVAALTLGLLVNVTRVDFLILCLTILLVLVAEMVNTAIEVTVDMISEEYHPLAKIIKDIAAGVVLLASVGALTVGYLVLYPALKIAVARGIWRVKKAPHDVIAVASLTVVVILVIIFKAILGRGEPLRGGMPSGHAAIAFSLWTASLHFTTSLPLIVFIFAVAVIVSWSRWSSHIHRPVEVFAGAALGAGVTAFFFWLFS